MSDDKGGSGESSTQIAKVDEACCTAIEESCCAAEPTSTLGNDLRRFMRNHPGTTVALSVGAGVFLGRFFARNKRR